MAAVIGRGVSRGVGGVEERKCLQSPFAFYLVVTVSLNTVAIAGGLISQFDLHRGQSSWYGYDRCDSWLFTNGIFGILHILGALYIVRKIREPEDAVMISTNDYQPAPSAPVHGKNTTSKKTSGKNTTSKKTSGMKKMWGKQQDPLVVIEAQVVPPQQQQQQQQPQQWSSDQPIVKDTAQKSMGAAESWPRIKHVLCENYVVAIYMLIYLIYLAWHFFSATYPCNQGMMFAQRTADIFIIASPCAFAFSVITMMMERRQL